MNTGGFTVLDWATVAVYLAAITGLGAWLGRGQTTGRDYFLGARSLPWGAVMLSVVATETSTLTFLSIPGVAYVGDLTFLQLTLGYLVGRIVVAYVLLPAYFRGELMTAYALLEGRFGRPLRRMASATFMVTRLLADSVRLFATAIPLALVTGWPYPVSIAVIAGLTLVYTYTGGIRAVVWTDALQMGLYLVGAVIAILAIHEAVPGGWGQILGSAGAAGKLQIWNLSTSLQVPYTLLAGLVGGGVFSVASHGTDQLIVQRLLACRSEKQSKKALVGSGITVMAQFLLFLMVGVGLWSYYGGQAFERSDEVFATFILEGLPPGITGLLIACAFAAAMSSLSSSMNSLASACTYDFWAPLRGLENRDPRLLRAGRFFTLLWAAALTAGAVAFIPASRQTSAVEMALGIAAVVYGPLLGTFALALLTRAPSQAAAVAGFFVSVVVVLAIRAHVAWLWYVPVGALAALCTGCLAARFGPFRRQAT